MPPRNDKKQGFSLIQVSVIVAVAGIILASVLPGGDLGSDNEKERITKEKMEKIEAATQGFMTANLRRPCPADGTLAISNANFGKEDTTSGSCSGSNFYTQSTPLTKTGTTSSTSAAVTAMSDTTALAIGMLVTGTNIAADTHIASIDSATQITLDKYPSASGADTLTFTSIAAGVVPVRTLGLSDDYMFDGYGRRIGYAVDIRATGGTTCRDMQVTKSSGAIQIMDASTATYTADMTMWALISYGKNGHGAFPMQGSSIANRIDSGATGADELVNAFIDSSFVTTFTQKLVNHAPVTAAGSTYFDDIVWTQATTKNNCCTGKLCMAGTRIDGAASEYLGTNVATGDINGDGIQDLILYSSGVNTVRIIFGSPTGWSPNAGLSPATANSSRFITITNDSSHPNFAGSVAAGDLNGDGYDDIAIGYGDVSSSAIKVFYGSAIPADTDTSAMTSIITFPATTANSAPQITIGNFANTTKKDILALITTSSGAGNSSAYVIYGASSYAMTAEAVTTTAASNGFKINTSSGRLENIIGTGDLNNDGYDDILISNYSNTQIYALFGESSANWDLDKTTAATGSTPDIIDIDTRAAAGGTEAVKLTGGGTDIGLYTLTAADMNGDGFKDLIFNSGNYFYVYLGKAAGSWASENISVMSTNFYRFDVTSNKPSWVTSANIIQKAIIADINGDGKNDIVLNDSTADPGSITDTGASFVALQQSSGWSGNNTYTLFSQIFDSSGTGLPLNNNVSYGFRIDGTETGIPSYSLGTADINNDGKTDLVLGTPSRNSNAGSIYIFFGKTLVPWDKTTSLKILN